LEHFLAAMFETNCLSYVYDYVYDCDVTGRSRHLRAGAVALRRGGADPRCRRHGSCSRADGPVPGAEPCVACEARCQSAAAAKSSKLRSPWGFLRVGRKCGAPAICSSAACRTTREMQGDHLGKVWDQIISARQPEHCEFQGTSDSIYCFTKQPFGSGSRPQN
jgi:hypothetical protein